MTLYNRNLAGYTGKDGKWYGLTLRLANLYRFQA
jgi:hypothetical protein